LIKDLYCFIRNVDERLTEEGDKDWVTTLGKEPLQILIGGPPSHLGKKSKTVWIQ
jgi:hypothetical protein